MAVFKCKMCGGDLNVTADEKITECEYCGTTQTVPNADDEKKTNLFNRANRLRMESEFDKAAGVYESIVAEFPGEAEGYWGLCLCAYGIEYVDDAKTGKKIPTCHRTLPSSIMDDENFEKASEYSDMASRRIYREEAKKIDELQKKIISVVESEEPYDIFICYKETDEVSRQRTVDSAIAQDIYTELIKEGYKVFFSRVTLRDKAGTEYEPYIYAALKSAKIMLAIGTKYEYYDAVWVKNEWSRYISMMAEDSSKHLIPCFKDLDAYDIPKEFKNLQALDMGEVTFFKNLTDNVERFIPKKETTVTIVEKATESGKDSSVEPLLKRMFMFLEDGEWESANEYAEKILDINPECADAYLGKLMAELKVRTQVGLKNCEKPFDEKTNYEKVMHFGDDSLKAEISGYSEFIQERNEKARIEGIYSDATKALDSAKFEDEFIVAAEFYESIKEYKDSAEKAKLCREKAEKVRIEAERKAEADRNEIIKYNASNVKTIFAGLLHTVGLKSDGTVVAVGENKDGQCNVETWSDVVAVATHCSVTVGLKSDGTVVAVGNNYYGQCNVETWSDIVAIATSGNHTVGLKNDGTVVAVGENEDGQCNVETWSDIVAIEAGDLHTVGLKSDGTVVAVGWNDNGECDVETWSDIIAIATCLKNTVGLKRNGDVISTKYTGKKVYYYGQCNVETWSDIMAISAEGDHTVGLKSDGTVVAAGKNEDGRCNVETWSNIVSIVGNNHTVGLKSDGTVVATGWNYYGQCNVETWSDIIAIATCLMNTVGLKKNGTVVAVGEKKHGQCNVDDWTDIALPIEADDYQDYIEKRKAEMEKAKAKNRITGEKRKQFEQQKADRRASGICQHCGGAFKGLITKTCVSCGKKKDY